MKFVRVTFEVEKLRLHSVIMYQFQFPTTNHALGRLALRRWVLTKGLIYPVRRSVCQQWEETIASSRDPRTRVGHFDESRSDIYQADRFFPLLSRLESLRVVDSTRNTQMEAWGLPPTGYTGPSRSKDVTLNSRFLDLDLSAHNSSPEYPAFH